MVQEQETIDASIQGYHELCERLNVYLCLNDDVFLQYSDKQLDIDEAVAELRSVALQVEKQVFRKNETISSWIHLFQGVIVFSDQTSVLANWLRDNYDEEDLDVILPLLYTYKQKPEQATVIIRQLRRLKD